MLRGEWVGGRGRIRVKRGRKSGGQEGGRAEVGDGGAGGEQERESDADVRPVKSQLSRRIALCIARVLYRTSGW